MSRRVRRSQRYIILGFMGGLAVAMSCATMEDILVEAKQVLYADSAPKLGVTDVQAAIDKLKARTEAKVSVDWTEIKNVPKDLADGDNVGKFTAGKGITINGATIDVTFGSIKDTAAHGDHAHTVTSKDLSDFAAAAKNAMDPKGNTNPFHHQRFGENDLMASAYILALEKKIKAIENQGLLSQIGALTKKIDSRAKCPRGYAPQTTPGMMHCKRGNDQVVRVGDFWIDRYEMLLVDTIYWDDGRCDLSRAGGAKYGDLNDPTYPVDFPRTGNWTNASKRLFPCSLSGRQPSRKLTWFQASQACAAAGKHLCTNEEWQTAAAGTEKSTCNTKGSVAKTGSSSCSSSWGAEDMVGNLSEFVAAWIPGGKVWMTSDITKDVKPWPSTYSKGGDETKNVNSRIELKPFEWTNGILAVPRRGGDKDDGSGAGMYAIDLTKGPAYYSNSTGARCCMR